MSVTNPSDGPASVSRRMKYRAENYLLDSKSHIGKNFTLNLEAERTKWNESHGDWKVSGNGIPPSRIAKRGGVFLPPSLDRDLRSLSIEQSRAHLLGTGRMSREEQALTDWWDVTDRIARYWWPPEDFPIDRFGAGHPAQLFISLCLCFSHSMVPSNWIDELRLTLHWVTRPPELLVDVLVDTLLALERHAGSSGGQRLGPNMGLTPDMLESAITGIRERLQIPPSHSPWILHRTARGPEPGDYLYVPVPHSVTREAVESAAPQIAKDAQSAHTQKFVSERARELSANGATAYEIAIRLGVTDKTVHSWLDASEIS